MPSHYFYPRSPCGERRKITITVDDATLISIHALLAESDFKHLENRAQDLAFLSTLSLRRATNGSRQQTYQQGEFLSTLSLRRATTVMASLLTLNLYFYPRSPCGERRVTVLGIQHKTGISIHALLAESDNFGLPCILSYSISIHALLAESDPSRASRLRRLSEFLSTLSLRRATIMRIRVVTSYL